MSEHEPKPVAWRNEHGAVTNFQHGADAWRDAGILSEPLYPASVVTALQEENERLRAALADERKRALEEAAKALDAWGDIYGDNAAKTVRSLMEKPE